MLRSAGRRPLAAVGSLAIAALLLSRPTTGETGADLARRPPNALVSGLSLSFEPNRGQTSAAVDFLGRGPGITLFLERGDAVLRVASEAPAGRRPSHAGAESATVRMRVLGAASRRPAPTGLEPLSRRSDYLVGQDRRRWITEVPNFAKVRYSQIYPGIDLVYHGAPGQLEFDFHVAPYADPGQIQLRFTGAELSIDDRGDLALALPAGRLALRKPTVYQDDGGVRRSIAGRYVRAGRDRVRFRLERYDRSLPLVIDPVVAYSSYIGGSGSDAVYDLAADASGALYLAGVTSSVDFPTADPLKPALAGSSDAWICKLAPGGAAAEYCAFLGGSGDDTAQGVAVDGEGQVYLTGATRSADFPVQGSVQPTFGGGGDALGNGDAFVLKLDGTGRLAFSTYLGGTGADGGRSVAVDGSGVYVGGITSSSDFPLANALQPVPGGAYDGFVAKLSLSGAALEYSTFFGGSGQDRINGIAVDAASNLYVAGQTDSPDFATVNAAQAAYGGAPSCGSSFCGDGFVAKLDSAGAALVYSTYLGGSDDDGAVDVAVQGGRALVAGFTRSADFPTTSAAFQASLGGSYDGHVTRLGEDGSLLASTYLGGSGRDQPRAIAATPSGEAYVVGFTTSPDYPVSADALQRASGGARDAFISRVAGSGSALPYSSYLGGSGDEVAFGVSLLSAAKVAVCGYTSSSDLRVESPLQVTSGGGVDGFFLVLGDAGTTDTDGNKSGTQDSAGPLNLAQLSEVSTADAGASVGPLTIFAADCVTPKTDFLAGEIACVTVSYDTPPGGPRRLNWVSPSGAVPRVAEIATNPQTDSFRLPVAVSDLGTWTLNELDLGNDTVRASAAIIVRDANQTFANLGVYKAIDLLASLEAGASLSSLLFVWNRGPEGAANVVVTDTTPANATFVSVAQQSGPAFSCAAAGATTTCTTPTLARDATAVFAINYQLTSASNVVNPASVFSSTAETDGGDDDSTATATLPGGDVGGGGGDPGNCTLACPADITRNNDAGQAGAVVSFTDPTTTGTCGPVACDPASGSFFPIGSTQVACTASPQSCSFLVTVNDAQAITITILGDNPLTVECHGTLTDPGATAQNGLGQSFPVTASLSPDPDERLDVDKPGTYTITYTATDGTHTAVATRTVNVVDTAAPIITLNGSNPLTAECRASFTDPGATAADACAAAVGVTASGTPDVNTPGAYAITYDAVDPSGNAAAPVTRTVNVVDTTAPTLTVADAPLTLWPPNHEYATFMVSDLVLAAGDSCDAGVSTARAVIAEVSSDEPNAGGGDDILIGGDCRSVQLQAERAGGGNGRVYTVVLKVQDASGNVTTASTKVAVPHDQRKGGIAVDDGPSYSVTAKCQ